MVLRGTFKKECGTGSHAAEQNAVRGYIFSAGMTDAPDCCADTVYAAAVVLRAAGDGADIFAPLFGDAAYIFEARGHIVVLSEDAGIKQRATRAAAETNTFVIWKEKTAAADLPGVFADICRLEEYSFYAGSAARLEDIKEKKRRVAAPDERRIDRLMHSDGFDRIKGLCDRYFSELAQCLPEPKAAVTETARLIYSLLRGGSDELKRDCFCELMKGGFSHASDCALLCGRIIDRICAEHGEGRKLSPLIADTLEIIEQNLSNDSLSLRWIAQEVLFTNADYLGKLFKKEIGDNFTDYVKRMRMELAKKLILEGKRDRIYEVAEKVGFGTNSQYFSQVFKKYTGVSPLEYKSVMQNHETVNNLYDIRMGENV